MKTPLKKIIAILIPVILIRVTVYMVVDIKCIEFYYQGFGVDSSENVYIGRNAGLTERNGKIDVYKDGDFIKSIDVMTGRGYRFKVYNDNILLTYASKFYVLDLDGNVTAEKDDIDGKLGIKLISNSTVCTTKDGTRYILKNTFGRYKVVCGERTLFEMPLLHYVLKVSSNLLNVMFFIITIAFICVFRLSYKNKT